MLSPFRAKEFLHGGDRYVDLLVVEVVVSAADRPHAANHSEGGVVDGDGFAQHGAAGKQQVGGLEAQHHDAAALGEVHRVNEAASCHGDEANHGVVRFHSHDLA